MVVSCISIEIVCSKKSCKPSFVLATGYMILKKLDLLVKFLTPLIFVFFLFCFVFLTYKLQLIKKALLFYELRMFRKWRIFDCLTKIQILLLMMILSSLRIIFRFYDLMIILIGVYYLCNSIWF